MFSHVMIGADDMDASKAFYDAALGELGVRPGRADSHGRVIYMHDGNVFMLTPPINGEPASGANGGTIGFAASTPELADKWHETGATNGGKPIEDPPGFREAPVGKVYLAYLLDPAGNKVCAMHMQRD